jgi:tRNA pseudouridine synthase 10
VAPDLAPLLEPARVSAAARMLAQAKACDHCLGRCFGKLGSGATNPQRGEALRATLQRAPTAPLECEVCQGLFAELDHLAGLAAEALGKVEHRTFLIGTRVDPDLQQAEQRLAALGEAAWAEPITAELNREVGKRVAALTGKVADVKKPDATAVVDTRFDVVELQVAPLFLRARYRKFSREIPQTRWPCRLCRGTGCHACGMTGKQYQTSVQELVQAPALEAFQARDADFHGMGREDIDARCIGTGRPFILELREPKVRTVDLAALEQAINAHARPRVEVEGLRWAVREEVAALKAADSTKAYRAEVAFSAPVPREALEQALAVLKGSTVEQFTPERVQHRRAMLTRTRSVLDAELEEHAGDKAVLRIHGQAGLYIKELVSGDGGRTKPNLAEALGVEARVTALDVVAVDDLAGLPGPGPARDPPGKPLSTP